MATSDTIIAALLDSDADSQLRALCTIPDEEVVNLLPNLERCLMSPDPRVRIEAAEIIVRAGEAEKATRLVAPLLEDPEDSVRHDALLCLASIEPPQLDEQTLRIRLNDRFWAVRGTAASLIGELGFDSRESLQALLVLFDDEHAVVRGDAYLAVAHLLGDKAEPYLPRVHRRDGGPLEKTRLLAAHAIAGMGLGPFLGLLHEEDQDVVFLSLQIVQHDFEPNRFSARERYQLIQVLDMLLERSADEALKAEARRGRSRIDSHGGPESV